jgi:glycosyltransferase involved in cell wall biosynthesis
MSLDVFGRVRVLPARRAQFTVGEEQNVRLRSGWFSERDACYLASGKPVIILDTGFSRGFTGGGLFAFRNVDDALAAIDTINSDYRRHCSAARAIAEEYFAASKVGAALLKELGA